MPTAHGLRKTIPDPGFPADDGCGAGSGHACEPGTGRIAEAASFVSIDRNLPSLGAGAYTHTIAAFGSRDIWRIPDASCHTSPRVAEADTDSPREGSSRRLHIHRRRRNRTGPVVGSCRLANSGSGARGTWHIADTRPRTSPPRRRPPRRASGLRQVKAGHTLTWRSLGIRRAILRAPGKTGHCEIPRISRWRPK